MNAVNHTAAIVTISNKGSLGEHGDTSGPALTAVLNADGWEIC